MPVHIGVPLGSLLPHTWICFPEKSQCWQEGQCLPEFIFCRMVQKIYQNSRAGKGSAPHKLGVKIFCSVQCLQTEVYFEFLYKASRKSS